MTYSHTTFLVRRKVLFVDDDLPFLATAARLFNKFSHGSWDVQVESQAARVLPLLAKHRMDLLIIDPRPALLESPEVLAAIKKKHPSLPIAILTSQATERLRAACLGQGASLCLDKVVAERPFEKIFNQLNDLMARATPLEGFQGVLRRVGLADVLQMECLARSSSVLDIASDEITGRIYIKSGSIIHAQMGSQIGPVAFDQLMRLRGGNFSLNPFEPPPLHTIEGNWEFLVMEALRKRDEALEGEAPQPTAVVPACPASPLPHSHALQPTASIEALVARSSNPPGAPAQAAPAHSAAAQASPPSTKPPVRKHKAQPTLLSDFLRDDTEVRHIEEIIICSGSGEVLSTWQCHDLDGRLELMRTVRDKAERIGRALSLGRFDRIEMEGPSIRAVAQFHSNRQVWARASDVALVSRPSLRVMKKQEGETL